MLWLITFSLLLACSVPGMALTIHRLRGHQLDMSQNRMLERHSGFDSFTSVLLPPVPAASASVTEWNGYDDSVLAAVKGHDAGSKEYIQQMLKRKPSQLTNKQAGAGKMLYRLVRNWILSSLGDASYVKVSAAVRDKLGKSLAVDSTPAVQVLLKYTVTDAKSKKKIQNREAPNINVYAYNKEILEAVLKAFEINKPKGVDKVGIVGHVSDLSGTFQPQAVPGNPGVPLVVRKTGDQAGMIGSSSLGVCLINPSNGIVNPKDKVITTWHNHNGGHVGADVLFPVSGANGATELAFIGTIESGGHRISRALDYDIVKLRPRYSCNCVGEHSITQTFENVHALQDYMWDQQDAKQPYNSYARTCRSGVVSPQAAEDDNTLYVSEFGNPKTDQLILTSLVTQKGDSGSALIVENQIVGILHGGWIIPDDPDKILHGAWTPIWSIPIPAPYKICL